jgi:benzylsuccinate CoA-transferase BbsF subunit
MSNSRDESLNGLSVLALGNAVPTRIAACWLAESGACVSHWRGDWPTPPTGSGEARFDRQTLSRCAPADFNSDAPYDVIVTDTASQSRDSGKVPAALRAGAVTVEVTSPLPVPATFDEALIHDMILWSRSGLGYLTREIDADFQLGGPCLPCNRQASILAGIAAATAGVAISLDESGAAKRHIAVDQLELLALMPMQPVAFAQLDGRIVGKPSAHPAPRMPGGTVATANGMAFVAPVEPAHWATLLRLIGGLDSAADQVADNPAILREEVGVIDAAIRAWARRLTSEELADQCQAEHIPVAPVYRPDQMVTDAHLRARAFFHVDGARLNPPWLASVGAKAAVPERAPGADIRPPPSPNARRPLAGLRVLDLSWAWAGPFAASMLSDLGAEVINVEWHPRASNLRRNPPFAGRDATSNNTAAWWSANQRGKFSIGVDLKSDAGKQIVAELAAVSDVVVENFSPGTVDRLGVGYDELVKANPRLVYVSLSAFGQSGPRSHYIGYGTQVYAAAGAGYATSQDGVAFSQMFIPYPDPVSGLGGAYAMAAYVRNARQSGRPAKVDVSELEVVAAVVLEPLLSALADLSELPAVSAGTPVSAGAGDRGDDRAHGAGQSVRYRVVTTRDECFVVLIAREDSEWQAFAEVLGGSVDGIDEAAAGVDADALLANVGDRGLNASLIADSSDVLADPWLTSRGFWTPDLSPEVAPSGALIGGSVWHVDGERMAIWRGAPRLFGDTGRVLGDLLGYDEAAIAALLESGSVA